MCKVYNTVGSLTAVKSHLHKHNITEFKSIKEVIAFQNSYTASRQKIISNSEVALEIEKNNLISENLQLKSTIELTEDTLKNKFLQQIEYVKVRLEKLSLLNSPNPWQKIANYFRIVFLKKKIRKYEQSLPSKVLSSVHHLTMTYQKNQNRYNYITSNFQEAVIDNCSAALVELDRKKAVIDEISSSIYGAIGEHKVVKELEKLPDEFVLINDFCLSFDPPVFNRSENDYIKSIQVDHLLIAPSGIYLIETKNWSEESLNSPNLRSPVSQLKRSSFALFTALNNRIQLLGLYRHHWGKQKITLKNIVVLINQKPFEEFQYVKVLTSNQLVNYISYFPPIFTLKQTERIAKEMINLSNKMK